MLHGILITWVGGGISHKFSLEEIWDLLLYWGTTVIPKKLSTLLSENKIVGFIISNYYTYIVPNLVKIYSRHINYIKIKNHSFTQHHVIADIDKNNHQTLWYITLNCHFCVIHDPGHPNSRGHFSISHGYTLGDTTKCLSCETRIYRKAVTSSFCTQFAITFSIGFSAEILVCSHFSCCWKTESFSQLLLLHK